MPTLNENEQTSLKPVILTSIGKEGVSALDIRAVPHDTLVSIVLAAMLVCAEVGNDNLRAETKDAEEALDDLSSTLSELDKLHRLIVPGRDDIEGLGITVDDDEAGYPVIRDGHVGLVKATDLTALEKSAVHQWLSWSMAAGTQSAESFKARLEQFERETA